MDDLTIPFVEDFVDREEQLRQLWSLVLGQIQQRVCVLNGPEGIGKSYLLKEFTAECAAKGLSVGRVLPEVSQDLNDLNIILRLWEDLNLGDVNELYQKVAIGRVERHIQYVPAPVSSGSQVGVAVSGSPSFYGPVITGQVSGSVETKLELTINDDPTSRWEVQAVVTPFLQERLVSSGQLGRVVLVLDSWDRVLSDSQTGSWLKDNLIRWVLEGEIPGTTLIVCGGEELEFTHLPMRVLTLNLNGLPDNAVKAYWVDRCKLSPTDVPEVIQITNGIPQALYLTAAKTMVSNNQTFHETRNIGEDSESEKVTGLAIESLLEALPAEFSRLIRLCAWPHWFDRELFDLLAIQVGCSAAYFDQFVAMRFVHLDATGFYFLDQSVRRILLTGLKSELGKGVSEPIFGLLLGYFERLKDKVSKRQNWAVEKEILYFRLLSIEESGLGDLSERFEKAVRLLQYGLAEQYIEHVSDLEDILSKNSLLWMRYFRTRLKLFYSSDASILDEIEVISAETIDPILQGACQWSLGICLVEEQEWSKAANLYKAALRLMKRESRTLYTMMVMVSQAEVYRDLVQRSGGFQAQDLKQGSSQLMMLLYGIQHFPYLIYEWGVHHFRFLPNWYFGTNYQDWIQYYLLMESGHWYRNALRSMPVGDNYWNFEIQLGLANVEHQLGRWAKAKQHYADLLELDLVLETPYRNGLVMKGQGEALVYEGKLSQGKAVLEACSSIFEEFHDDKNSGGVFELIGRINFKNGQTGLAVDSYLRAMRAYEKAGDRLSTTEMVDILEDLSGQVNLPDQRQVVENALQTDLSRNYLTRFPDKLLSWYRKVAMYGAMPLTYCVLIFLSFASGMILNALEGEFLFFQKGINLGTTLGDIIIISAAILLPVPIGLWLYRLFYSLIGVIVVYIVGHRLVPIEKEQPRSLEFSAAGIQISRNEGRTQEVAWVDINKIGHESVCLINREIKLVTRTFLVLADGSTHIIEGVTSGYDPLKKGIQRRLQSSKPTAEIIHLPFPILDWRWISIIALFSALIVGYLWQSGRIHGDYIETRIGGQVYTFVGPAATVFLPTFTLAFVAVSLWRNMFHSMEVRKKLHVRPTTFPVWVRWFTAILASLITFFWILVFFL